MTKNPNETCKHRKGRKRYKRTIATFGLVTLISVVWLAIRSGTRPSRISYPCQQSALSNIQLLKVAITSFLPGLASLKTAGEIAKPIIILAALTTASFVMISDPTNLDILLLQSDQDDYTRVPLTIVPQAASSTEPTSDLFYVQNATGLEGNLDDAVNALINLMSQQGSEFYQDSDTPEGLIKSNDVIIIKMNGQWESRGGTNTDLIKSVIEAIIAHPDGFTGEVIVADNGQGIGNLDRPRANAYVHNQSAQDVVDSFFPTWNVSTFLWDDLHFDTVDDYDEGDFIDGYVRSTEWNNETQMYVSYPKFMSPATGEYISFKKGIWTDTTGFDNDRLKVINMPVLKSHELLGVTACVKHYMGVPQGYVVPSVDPAVPHEHFSVRLGGMGELIAETRVPVLNILDMIWINPHPLESSVRRGPWSTYPSARFTDIIGASIDPVALDYWSAKNILMPTSDIEYTNFSSLNPDYEPTSEHINYPYVQQEESFHNYLERSMVIMRDAGLQVTMDEDEMSVFCEVLSDRPIIPVSENADVVDPLPIIIIATTVILVVLAIAVQKKRAS